MRSCLDFTALVIGAASAAKRVDLCRNHPGDLLAMGPHGCVNVRASGVGQSVPAVRAAAGNPGLLMGSVVKLAVIADDMTSAVQNTARNIKTGYPRRSRNAAEARSYGITMTFLRIVKD